MYSNNLLSNLPVLSNIYTARESSYDRSGKNADCYVVPAGKSVTLLDLKGAGCIKHLYMAFPTTDHTCLRTCVLRIYWENEKSPGVEVPVGDFFGAGNCIIKFHQSLSFAINPGSWIFYVHGYHCYLPMPFGKQVHIEFENQSKTKLDYLWFHIEYEKYKKLPGNTGRFHAVWNRENPTNPVTKANDWSVPNKSDKENYPILYAKGRGNYLGCFLYIDNLSRGWYGEGDDMMFIDDEKFPPRYHGTGTEEIFGAGACPNLEYQGPYSGCLHIEDPMDYTGKNHFYRFYLNELVRFQKSIRVSVEHGHANDKENDYSSCSFWYQDEPHVHWKKLPPPEERIPRLPEIYYKSVNLEKKARKLTLDVPKWTNKYPKIKNKLITLWSEYHQSISQGYYSKAYTTIQKINQLI